MRWWLALAAVGGCTGASVHNDAAVGAADASAVPIIARERSLVWIDPDIVDDPAIVGLARVMAAVGDDGHGGVRLRDMLQTFAVTAHSERPGPALLAEALEAQFGADPSAWDLDQLPFQVTAVHNRIDLAPRNGGCGELRVSLASTHPVYAPLHMIFLFRQEPGVGDIDGETIHCRATAARWAALSELDQTAFVAAANDLLEESLVRPRFLLAESVELTVSPWEWRQWVGLTNPPLFQTIDTARLNQPGTLREDFIRFATDNAAALMARELALPARFRAQSAQAPPSVPREPLDLEVAGYPRLAAEIEIMGCPSCHTDDAEFVHTTPQRTFSPFYDKELDARAVWLSVLAGGGDPGVPPFGPLQNR
jgi:hypothetical protein